MIQNMRELAQSTIARILVGIIIVLLLLFGYGSFDVFNAANTAVAEVNGTEVARAEYEREIEMQRRLTEGRIPDDKLRADVLDRMVKRTVLLDLADDLGLSVGSDAVDRRITSDPAFVEDGKFSQTLYLQRLTGAGIRPAEYRRSVEESSLLEQLQQGIAESEFLTTAELRRIEALANQQRDLAWVDIDPASFAAITRIDDAAARSYFATNARNFRVPESVVVDYMRIGAADLARSVSVTPAEIEAEYRRAADEGKRAGEKRRVAHIQLTDKPGRSRADAKALLAAAAKRIATSADFAAVARELSEDAISRDAGGDLGSVGRNELPEQALDAATWRLAVGATSEPIESTVGVHLVRVLGTDTPSYPALAEVRGEIEARVRDTKTKQRITSVKGELTDLAYEQDLAALGKRYGVAIQRSAAIPRAGVAQGIAGNAAVRTAAFSNDVRNGDFNSGVLDVDGDLVVLRVAKYQAARAMTFAEARPQVFAAAQRQRQLALARERASRLVRDVQQSGSLTPSIQALAVTWQSRAGVRRDGAEIPPPILQAAFELPRPGGAVKANGNAVTLPNGHIAAVVVTRVVDGVGFAGPEQAMLRNALGQQSGQRQFSAFIERAEAGASVERLAATDAAATSPVE